jgi:hypothetical protein
VREEKVETMVRSSELHKEGEDDATRGDAGGRISRSVALVSSRDFSSAIV